MNAAGNAADFEAETKALLDAHGPLLLDLARSSILNGLNEGSPLHVNVTDYPPELAETGACFVTLKLDGKLRGCIGSPEARRSLIMDVAENAHSAAFQDPRFPPLTADEYGNIELSISVLSPSTPMTFTDQADLLAQLRPGVDGLIIEDGRKRALFLPSVWRQLPDKETFLGHLKIKAGMDADYFSPAFRAWRFIAAEISDTE